MLLLYDFLLAAYSALIHLAALVNPKARAWVRGRTHPEKALSSLRSHPEEPVVWIHCASLGEFEQGRPVLEAIRQDYPQHRILLTFFSPSGYETRKHYAMADLVCYLPLDGRYRSRHFLNEVRPCLAIFIKYEHWQYYLSELSMRGIPTLSVSAVFRPSQPFFQSYGGFWRKMLQHYSRVFVQDASSWQLLARIGLSSKAEVSGDTRFDRVLSIASSPLPVPWMADFIQGRHTLVAGSTWPDDERLLALLADQIPDLVILIAPHEFNEQRLSDLEKRIPGTLRFSNCQSLRNPSASIRLQGRCLVVDNFGWLSSIYQYATIAYVGGGFNRSGIHNILEAVVYGIPVFFGPHYERSREAFDLVALKGAYSVGDDVILSQRITELLTDQPLRTEIGQRNAGYVQTQAGATNTVLRYIHSNRLLSKP